MSEPQGAAPRKPLSEHETQVTPFGTPMRWNCRCGVTYANGRLLCDLCGETVWGALQSVDQLANREVPHE